MLSSLLDALGHVLGAAALTGAGVPAKPVVENPILAENFYHEYRTQGVALSVAQERAKFGRTSCVRRRAEDSWSVRDCPAPPEEPAPPTQEELYRRATEGARP